MIRLGIAIYDNPEKWSIVLAENDFHGDNVYFYKIVSRVNGTWLRTGHTGQLSYETGLTGVLHVADLHCDMAKMHGRMQNVYSGQGHGVHANPTQLDWGPRAWVVRALRTLATEDGVVLPAIPDWQMPAYINIKILDMKRHGARVWSFH